MAIKRCSGCAGLKSVIGLGCLKHKCKKCNGRLIGQMTYDKNRKDKEIQDF